MGSVLLVVESQEHIVEYTSQTHVEDTNTYQG